MRVVIDCNVLIAANRRDTTSSLSCSAACARQLLHTSANDVLLEDASNLILEEYKRYCNFSGQPSPADRFFYWFIQNRWTPERVARVEIGANEDEIETRIPSDLKKFDRSDQKFIATYLCGAGEVLFNALDSDWAESADAIKEAGIKVVELCDTDLRRGRR